MRVHDFKTQNGDHRMTIVTVDGKIAYIMIDNAHILPDEFERMYQHYLDFEESDDVGTDE